MIVHRSNRTEVLIAELAEVVGAPGLGAFSKETLVVQGRGMERWLCMQLADRLGIWANPEVLKPRGFLESVFKRVLESEINPAYNNESLMWSIADLLPDLIDRKEFASIQRYLARDEEGRRRVQLSYQIANTFDEYMAHRPEMMVTWLNAERTQFDDPDEPWQAMLWRELTKRLGSDHLAGRASELMERLARGALPAGCLPERVSIFGVSSLPRLYLDLYTALSQHLELHLFILSPTREYWADIATPHEARRELRLDRAQDEASLHLDESPSLLASLGRLGRDFHRMIEEDGSYQERSGDLYREPLDERSSMLAVLQSDILNLRARPDENSPRRSIEPHDRSIRVHSCHGPMREVEVLCEELLSSFEADRSLEPQDIIVMMPSVRTYAPYIEAVFGTRTNKGSAVADGEGTIPYRIADRWPQPGDQVVDAFSHGLDFIGSRFGVSDALDLLDIECIRRRFEFDVTDLPTVRAWIVEAGIRFGVDASHRESIELPASTANTWQFGLDRLLLGYALEDDQRSVFHDARPMRGVEGQGAEVLGRVIEFFRFLSAQRLELEAPRSLAAWRTSLLDFLAGLVVYGDETQEQHQTLRSALDKLTTQAELASFEGEVSLVSVREQLDRSLELAHAASGFLTGGVTFCELVPMRSIPFRVVCLLGMNDDEFPRIRHALGFDLIAKKRRVGDRTAREDDRYLFLEAILSAREQLIVSYVGQSIKDGAVLPPSAVVSELIDTITETFEAPGADEREVRESTRRAVVLTHPLQPYSTRYFTQTNPLDFDVHSARYCEAADLLAAPRHKELPFLEAPVALRSNTTGDESMLAFEELLDFFQHPVRSFLRSTLQVSLRAGRDPLAQREPFALDNLEEFRVGSELLSLVRSGMKLSDAQALIRSSGQLPHGVSGDIVFSDLANDVEHLALKVSELVKEDEVRSASFELQVDGSYVRGTLVDVTPHGQVFCRFSKLGRRAELSAWLHHLVLLAAQRQTNAKASGLLADVSPETYVIGRADKEGGATVVRFHEVSAPEEELAKLVQLFRVGATAPLPFFPNASREFARKIHEKASAEVALAAARTVYEGTQFISGEAADANNALAFRGMDPVDPATKHACGLQFAEVAEQVYLSLLDAREEVE